ncbi:SDR family oxidoreductase [bacterium]|nr:SDR family oxidoreductase [bacterium]
MQHCVVTGGVRGIGRAVANELLKRGARVAVLDCLTADDPAVHDLIAQGVLYQQVDIASAQAVADVFAALDGKGFIPSVLVNNAGISKDALLLRLQEHDWDRVLAVNLKGTMLCSQQALKRMIKQPISYIINLSSVVGLHGNAGQAAYAASKAGIIGLTKSLAQEYAGRNVLVNAIAPGFIQTAMTDLLPEAVKQKALDHIPLKRFGCAQDVAQLVAFLTSGEADYITGQVICVSGGM